MILYRTVPIIQCPQKYKWSLTAVYRNVQDVRGKCSVATDDFGSRLKQGISVIACRFGFL